MAEDANNNDAKGGNDDLSKEGVKNQPDATKGNDDNGLTAEKVQQMIKDATSGRDAQIGKLTNELESIKAREEQLRLEKMSEEDQLSQYRAKAESFEKKEKFRAICREKGLDSEKYMATALRMDVNELETYVTEIKTSIDNSIQEAVESAKRDFTSKIPQTQPNGDSAKINEDDAFLKGFKIGAKI